jgi:hypothetical protein
VTYEVHFDDVTREYALGRWRDVAIHLWRAQLNGARLAVAKRHSELCKAACGGHYVSVIIFATEGGAFEPDISEEARRGVADMVRWSDSVVSAAVGVVEGTGFLPAMIRAAGNGIALVAKPKFPLKIVSTVDEGARWLGKTRTWTAADSAHFIAAVSSLRARSLALG